MKAKSNGSVGGHRAQGVERRAQPQVDPLRQPRLLEVAARDARPLLVHVAADQLAVVGQAAGDADRRVAGEGAELQRAAGADRPHQEGHQRPLLGGDLHDRDPAQLGGLGGQPPQQLILARAVLDHVAVQLRGQDRELVRHRQRRPSGGREPASQPDQAADDPRPRIGEVLHQRAGAGARRRRPPPGSSRTPRSDRRAHRRGAEPTRRRARPARSRCRRPSRVKPSPRASSTPGAASAPSAPQAIRRISVGTTPRRRSR